MTRVVDFFLLQTWTSYNNTVFDRFFFFFWNLNVCQGSTLRQVIAFAAYTPNNPQELTLSVGDVIRVDNDVGACDPHVLIDLFSSDVPVTTYHYYVTATLQDEDDWAHGTILATNKSGWFPLNHTNPQTSDAPPNPSVNEAKAIALYPFKANTERELSLAKDEIITVTRQEAGGWWKGTGASGTGWFPAQYVKVMCCTGEI